MEFGFTRKRWRSTVEDSVREELMKRLLLIALLLLASTAWAADDSVLGTHWVKFEPFQVAGQLKGCSLVHMAVVVKKSSMWGIVQFIFLK